MIELLLKWIKIIQDNNSLTIGSKYNLGIMIYQQIMSYLIVILLVESIHYQGYPNIRYFIIINKMINFCNFLSSNNFNQYIHNFMRNILLYLLHFIIEFIEEFLYCILHYFLTFLILMKLKYSIRSLFQYIIIIFIFVFILVYNYIFL